MVMAISTVPSGAAVHARSGEMLSPLQVNLAGMVPPSAKAVDVTAKSDTSDTSDTSEESAATVPDVGVTSTVVGGTKVSSTLGSVTGANVDTLAFWSGRAGRIVRPSSLHAVMMTAMAARTMTAARNCMSAVYGPGRRRSKTLANATGRFDTVSDAPLCLLTIHAHPDDEASKGAPTLAMYKAEGVRTVLVCCTGGEEGDLQNPHLREPGQPFHDLTPEQEKALLAELNADHGRSIVMVVHDLNHAARHAHHLIAMRDGQICAEGAPGEIVTAELVQEMFGIASQIVPDPVTGTPMVIPIGRRGR